MNGQRPIPQLPGDTPGGDGSTGGDINLAQPPDGGMGGPPPMGGPPGNGAPAPPEPSYPSVMLQGGPELGKIPDSGRMLVHHRVTSRRIHRPSHGPHRGKERHEVELELHKVRPMRGYKKAASKSKPSEDEAAMKRLMGDTEEEE